MALLYDFVQILMVVKARQGIFERQLLKPGVGLREILVEFDAFGFRLDPLHQHFRVLQRDGGARGESLEHEDILGVKRRLVVFVVDLETSQKLSFAVQDRHVHEII